MDLEQAACRNHPELNWFPARGEDQRAAKAVCLGECAIREECLAENLGEKFGIFGGASEKERRRIRVSLARLSVVGRDIIQE